MEFGQVLHMHWYWQHLGWDCYTSISQIYYRFMALDWGQNFVSAQFLGEQTDRIWPNFAYAYALILTICRLGLLHIYFHKFIIRVMALRISFLLSTLGAIWRNWPHFAYALILTRSRLGLLCVDFHLFITELWPLIDVRISLPLSIVRNNWQNLTKFCIWIDIENN